MRGDVRDSRHRGTLQGWRVSGRIRDEFIATLTALRSLRSRHAVVLNGGVSSRTRAEEMAHEARGSPSEMVPGSRYVGCRPPNTQDVRSSHRDALRTRD